MSHTETLRAWLKDAHAMEQGLMPLLEAMARRSPAFPELAPKAEEHLLRTRAHAGKVRECLLRLGESDQAIDAHPECGAAIDPALADGAPRDLALRNAVRGFASEQLEIAVYKAILVAAQAADDFQTMRVCEEILDEEEDMARWFEDHLPPAVNEFVMGAEG